MTAVNHNKPPAVLVVDDELLIRDLLFNTLSAKGYTVHLAENGKKARDLLEVIDFQVAIIDLKMPEMDGIELSAVLHDLRPVAPIIMMTAYPSMNSAIESIRKGVFDYIVKPFNITELSEILSRAVAEYERRCKSGYHHKSAGICHD